MNTKKVWLVTGASKGLGLILAKQLLATGYQVAATSRNISDLSKAISVQTEDFLPLEVDLVNEQSVAKAMVTIIKTFGQVDVVVNNAGYGQLGTLEEITDAEARQNFDINVFGSLNVIREAMPHMRAKKSGAIFNISSIGGFSGNFPGWGIYCATKFAVAGFTESLSAEAKAFGISATVVYPGYFRTDFLSKGSLSLPKKPIADYAEARELEAKHVEEIAANQPGDPEKAATVLITIAEMPARPLHLFLGKDSYQIAKAKIEAVEAEMVKNEALATATDLPPTP